MPPMPPNPPPPAHWSPAGHSVDDAQTWRPLLPHVAAHAVVAPPIPPPPPKLWQHTSPGLVQSAALAQVWPGGAVASSPPEVDPELDPEVDPELDPEPDPELDAPLELGFRPPPASSAGVPPVDPPHAAANAATQLPTKRTLSILMDDLL
jgi:hypothetical protein